MPDIGADLQLAYEEGFHAGYDQAMKEKQPRVLTFKEAIQIDDEVCIEVNHPETNRNYCRWCDLCYDGNMNLAMYTTHGIHIISEESYNKRWRVWSDRPTDEQRKAVPWETH